MCYFSTTYTAICCLAYSHTPLHNSVSPVVKELNDRTHVRSISKCGSDTSIIMRLARDPRQIFDISFWNSCERLIINTDKSYLNDFLTIIKHPLQNYRLVVLKHVVSRLYNSTPLKVKRWN